MARARNIKPGFFINDQLAEIQPLGRLLFAGLWTIADREGRLEDRPRKIKAAILPYDDCNIDLLLEDLQDAGFICRYEVGGEKYIQVVNFTKHQNPHKNEAQSEIPPCPEIAPDRHSTSTVQEQEMHTTNPADSLNPITDSLQPETLNPTTADAEVKTRKPKKDNRFNEFWLAYPRKDAKKDAQKAWGKLSPEEDLFQEIMDGLRRAKGSRNWIKDNGQFIPLPSTWLNGERWKDEINTINDQDREEAADVGWGTSKT
jgi:hypothetical protein